MPHCPAEHEPVALATLAQTSPQTPQLSTSDVRSLHAPPQSVYPESHATLQAPLLHTRLPLTADPVQGIPQPPQLAKSVPESIHASLQFKNPGLQDPPHDPFAHVAEPLTGARHAMSSPPQLAGSDAVSTRTVSCTFPAASYTNLVITGPLAPGCGVQDGGVVAVHMVGVQLHPPDANGGGGLAVPP